MRFDGRHRRELAVTKDSHRTRDATNGPAYEAEGRGVEISWLRHQQQKTSAPRRSAGFVVEGGPYCDWPI
jgi:hypothetical protein